MCSLSATHRFTVHKVTSQDLISFKTWWQQSYKKQPFSDETSGKGVPKDQKESFKISQYKQFLYNKDNPGKVVVRPFIDSATQSTFSLLKVNPAPNLPADVAYPSGKVPINVKKVNDLKKLQPYLVGYEEFYNKIFEWPTTDADCDVEFVYDN